MKNFKTLSSLLLTVGIVSVQAIPVQMPGGNWYEVVSSPVISWDNANTAANSLGGHLVTITSPGEDDFVLGLVSAFQAANQIGGPVGSEFWAGGFQDSSELVATAGWTWVNGEGTFPGDNSGHGYANWSQSNVVRRSAGFVHGAKPYPADRRARGSTVGLYPIEPRRIHA